MSNAAEASLPPQVESLVVSKFPLSLDSQFSSSTFLNHFILMWLPPSLLPIFHAVFILFWYKMVCFYWSPQPLTLVFSTSYLMSSWSDGVVTQLWSICASHRCFLSNWEESKSHLESCEYGMSVSPGIWLHFQLSTRYPIQPFLSFLFFFNIDRIYFLFKIYFIYL